MGKSEMFDTIILNKYKNNFSEFYMIAIIFITIFLKSKKLINSP